MSAKIIPFPQSPAPRSPLLTPMELSREEYLEEVQETANAMVAMTREYLRTGKCRDPRWPRKI